jgi:hypothetical protein
MLSGAQENDVMKDFSNSFDLELEGVVSQVSGKGDLISAGACEPPPSLEPLLNVRCHVPSGDRSTTRTMHSAALIFGEYLLLSVAASQAIAKRCCPDCFN